MLTFVRQVPARPARDTRSARERVLRSALTCASGAVLACVLCARADAEEAVLHEFLPSVSAEEVRAAMRSRARGPSPLATPGGGSAAARDAGPNAAAAAGGERGDDHAAVPSLENFRPDRLTSLEGGLDYYEAFNPSIAPFKRMTAFDAVRLDVDEKTPVLGVLDTRLREVPVEGDAAPAPDPRPRDRFRGDAELDFRSNVLQPLPSVSPESRVLSVSTQPALPVRVERDGADNMFVRVLGAAPDGKVRVHWETDAPRAYFGADIPTRLLRDLPRITRPERSVGKRAASFAGELGILPTSDLRTALEKLTSHFRNFVESAEPPADTGDLYLDLVQGGKGLCRHRAYGFVVTARALGIDARFVQNEAHSWVEVRLPDSGFVRIDLGGATHGLTAHDVQARRSYVPAQPDTLPRPAAYRQSHAQAARESAAAGQGEPTDLASTSGRWLAEEPSLTSSPTGGPAANSGEANVHEPTPQPLVPTKRPVHIALDDHKLSALRGGKLVLTGRALDETEHGVPGLRVEVWIARKERLERMLLAVQVSDPNGFFRADFGVPPDLAVGDYRLVVRTEGDAQHLPAAVD
ncbi:MAG: transglutaminase domain-containing protein [Polyangiales bacterium]